jgi:hypothetical protein
MHSGDVCIDFPLLSLANDDILASSQLLIGLGVTARHPPEATHEPIQESMGHWHTEERGGPGCAVQSHTCLHSVGCSQPIGNNKTQACSYLA